MKPQDGWKRGDVVQITDENHPWFPCILVVDEVKRWGVVAYVLVPKSNDGSKVVSRMYSRLEDNEVQRIADGSAYFVAPA